MAEGSSRKKVLTLKEKKKIYKANKFYDEHMAGKWNKKEGFYNHDLSSNTGKVKASNKLISVECSSCGDLTACRDDVLSFICSSCGKYNKVDV